MSCWGKWNAVLLMSFRGWNTDWVITWGMRCSVMFIRVKTSSRPTEEGMMAFTRAPLCSSLQCITAQTREPELIAVARVNACVGFIPACFWTVPEVALRGVYIAICHATSKTVRTPFIISISWQGKKYKINTVFVRYTCVPNRKTCTETFGTNTCTYTPLITGNKYLWPVNFLNSILAVKSILRTGCWIYIMIWLLDCWEMYIFGSTMCLEPISKMICLFLSLCVSLTSLSPRSAPLALSLMSTVSVCRLRLICGAVQTLADPNTLTN